MSSANSVPKASDQGKRISHGGKEYAIAREGLAEILIPLNASGAHDEASQTVFFNPIQQFNRDLSVLAIRIFGDDLAAIRRAKQVLHLQNDTKERKNRKRKRDDPAETPVRTDDISVGGTELENVIRSDEQALATTLEKSEEKGSKDLEMKLQKDANGIKTTPGRLMSLDNAIQTKDEGESGNAVKRPGDHPNHPIPTAPRKLQVDEKQSIKLSQPFRVLDALSATGLRALRYVQEVPSITSVTANDLSATATAFIKINVEHNKLTNRINTVTGNALAHMYRVATDAYPRLPDGTRGKYEVIDLDPYGTAVPFLDAAIQALNDGGLLCVTCTDAAVFASLGYLEKTFSLYGGLPIKGPQSHEGGLRLILHAIATSAARHGIAIEPLLSLSIDFYARVFVRVHRSPKEVKLLAGKTMVVYNCDEGCGSWSTQFIARTSANENKVGDPIYKFHPSQGPVTTPFCEHCGFKRHVAGPMWGGPLHNPYFVQRILDLLPTLDKNIYGTIPRIEGMLTIALEEVPLSVSTRQTDPTCDKMPRLDPAVQDVHPFFVIPSNLSRVLHCIAPSDSAFRGALIGLGYRVARSHTKAGSIRTNAPWIVIWEVMREWIRQKAPVKPNAIKPGTPGWGVMRADRTESGRATFRTELQEILEKGTALEEMKIHVEAALCRANKAKSTSTNTEENGDHITETTEAMSPTMAFQQKIPQLNVVFDEKLGKDTETKKLLRYQLNPRADWGPMTKAKEGHD